MAGFSLEEEKNDIDEFKKLPYATAYVDGTFYNEMYGGGYVVFSPKGELIYQDCGIGTNDPELLAMRNISGEMSAAMRAAHWIDTFVGRGVIVHDYIGLAHWVTGKWNTDKKFTKAYADYMRPFYTLEIIRFEWIKGHTGNLGNEIADRLARQAVVHNEHWRF